MTFDFTILDYIQTTIRSDILDTVMPIITSLGNGGILWIIASVLLLLYPKTRKIGYAVLLSLLIEAICCNLILKPLVGRIRPFDVNTSVQLLIPKPTDYSFPSGHTGASFAAAFGLYFSRCRLWIPALILSVLIGFSRLYLYVHYPTDVLAGALIGIISGWLGCALQKLMSRNAR